jgi:hypothetical protein
MSYGVPLGCYMGHIRVVSISLSFCYTPFLRSWHTIHTLQISHTHEMKRRNLPSQSVQASDTTHWSTRPGDRHQIIVVRAEDDTKESTLGHYPQMVMLCYGFGFVVFIIMSYLSLIGNQAYVDALPHYCRKLWSDHEVKSGP